jgi:hypothetical protein
MSEHEHTEPGPDERDENVDDLDVPDEQQEDVAGGRSIKESQERQWK